MSFLFAIESDKLANQLPVIFEKYESYIQEAEPLFEMEGQRLEKLSRDLPQHQAVFGKRAADMKQLIKWLENWKAKIESRLTRNYTQGQRVYGAREQTTFIAGEKEIVEINELIIEATLIYQKLDAINEAFKQMGWCLANIVKLRVAELSDVII